MAADRVGLGVKKGEGGGFWLVLRFDIYMDMNMIPLGRCMC